MTEKLYYKDAYMTEFSAEILAVSVKEGKTALVLDRTAFYPEGGGQGADTGILSLKESGRSFQVTDVQEEGEQIWHFTDAADPSVFAEGEAVCGRICWERRFDHMQQHSGEHIVSGMICRRFHCDNVGFHLGEDEVTIDYNTRISAEDLLKIEEEANRYLWENHPFTEEWPSPEELKAMEYRSKKELEGAVRITSFPGADRCACCGTHVKSSAEVGLVKFTGAHNFHEGTRITLYCGKRAMDFLRMNYEANKKTAVLLSTREDRTPEVVRKQLEELSELKARTSRMEESYFRMWAESFQGKENVLIVSNELEAEAGRKLSDLIADRITGLSAVFTRAAEPGKEKYRYACVKRNSDISGFIKEMNAALSGKGGGRGGFAQGNAESGEKMIRAFFAEQFGEKVTQNV